MNALFTKRAEPEKPKAEEETMNRYDFVYIFDVKDAIRMATPMPATCPAPIPKPVMGWSRRVPETQGPQLCRVDKERAPGFRIYFQDKAVLTAFTKKHTNTSG